MVDLYLAEMDLAYAAELCRICEGYVEASDEPAFDLDENGECHTRPVHKWCAWLEQNGHAAEEIRAALVTDEIF